MLDSPKSSSKFSELVQKIETLSFKRHVTGEQISTEKKYLKQASADLYCVQQAQEILQKVAKEVEEKVHAHLSSIVSKCLRMVFGENAYEFEIDFVAKRGKTEAQIHLSKDGNKLDPLDSTGGGVCDIAAFVLRVGVLSLRLPKPRYLLVLDEPMKAVSTAYRPKVAAMLELLAEELDFQMIVATHQEELKIGNVVEL